ncbi:MAG: gephyrin-like molybdotransferase Glp [Nitrospirota bacterium]
MTVKDMLGRSGVVSREEALKVLDGHLVIPSLPLEELSISNALGRVLAQEIVSPSDQPEFDRSTMDGYAVRSADTFGAAESRPAMLSVAGDIPMGVMPDRGIGQGEAMKIATGGALPKGADAVVMFEQTQPVDDKNIEVVKAVGPQENVSKTGEDMKKGEAVFTKGHVLRPQDMAALAGMGITRVPAFGKPRVAIISTGNEIVPADTVPGPGKIRDSNSYNLEGLISQAGGIAVKKGILPDDHDRLRKALEEALSDCHIILFTGGSSVGTADFTARVINDLGPPGVLIHGVSIKPGKPLIIGAVRGKGSGTLVPVFGLPGHQAAVSICFEQFVRPVLMRFTGAVPDPALEGVSLYRTVKAKLARSIASSPGREDHVRVTLEKRDDGLWARPVFGASGLISTLVKAVGTVVVPVNTIGIEAGEEVEVRLF